jgi:hypothetical protein
MNNGELFLDSSSNHDDIPSSFSCHSGLNNVDLAHVPLLDHGEDSQSINDTEGNNIIGSLKDAKGTIDKEELIQKKTKQKVQKAQQKMPEAQQKMPEAQQSKTK